MFSGKVEELDVTWHAQPPYEHRGFRTFRSSDLRHSHFSLSLDGTRKEDAYKFNWIVKNSEDELLVGFRLAHASVPKNNHGVSWLIWLFFFQIIIQKQGLIKQKRLDRPFSSALYTNRHFLILNAVHSHCHLHDYHLDFSQTVQRMLRLSSRFYFIKFVRFSDMTDARCSKRSNLLV